ncbi:MAG: Dna2/Cas4 domain-containing protein [Spirochaetaceae bacterium]|nr:Dna2/Cas4 domain-containing protein [Spirochaetaceae bacterium]
MLEKARYLRELAETYGLHGLYFQHVALCRRRAWLHLMGATHAISHSRVRRGLALHQTEKRPGAVPKGLGIAPDAIDFARRVVIERKGSAGGPDAVSRQALFYAAVMTGASGEAWRAEVQVYGSRKTTIYELTEEVLDQLIQDARESSDLAAGAPPPAYRIRLCGACSCSPLCWDNESEG